MKLPTHVINPITIIAIFAGLAEASASSVIPYLGEQDRKIYIWFLIAFPSALVVMFFLTINFNQKALFMPPKHRNENRGSPEHEEAINNYTAVETDKQRAKKNTT